MISVDAGLFNSFGNALGWSLVMDTIIGKMGWSDVKEEETFTMVMPWQFGVFAEEVTDLESQPAFVHTYQTDYDNACQRPIRAGLANKIDQLNVVNTPFESPFPEMVTRDDYCVNVRGEPQWKCYRIGQSKLCGSDPPMLRKLIDRLSCNSTNSPPRGGR